jgi:hypothetical protein
MSDELKGGQNQSSQVSDGNGLYNSPQEALKKVSSEYEYWSGKLTETSLQMCYALIAANWVIFGSINGVLKSIWAKSSLVMVMIALGSNVIAALMLSESLKKQMDYGEGHAEVWANQFEQAIGKNVAWPFTDTIQNTGRIMRWIKGCFTIAGAMCFIIGVIVK